MTAILKSLQEVVTPAVLNLTKAEEGNDTDKSSVLDTLYALVATKLTDTTACERVLALSEEEQESGIMLFDTLFADEIAGATEPTFVHTLYNSLADKFTLPTTTISALVLGSLPLIFKHLKAAAGTKSIPAYLSEEREGLLSAIPAWLVGLLPAGLLGASALGATALGATGASATTATPTATPNVDASATLPPVNPLSEPAPAVPSYAPEPTSITTTTTKKEDEGFLKGLLPIIGLLIFAGLAWLMLKSCQKQPTPVATPSAEVVKADGASLAPATLDLTLDNKGEALADCRASVGTSLFGEKLRASIAKVFGADTCDVSESKDTDVQMPAEQYLPQLLGFMKGVPDANLAILDKTITLNSSDPKALEKLVADVTTALPNDFTVVGGEHKHSDSDDKADTDTTQDTDAVADTDKDATASADTTSALGVASLGLALNDKGNGVASCDGTVATGLGDKVRTLLTGVFGADKCSVNEKDGNTQSTSLTEPQLIKALELMQGVPNATFHLHGNTLSFGSSDPKALEKLLADVKDVVGADFVVEAEPVLNESETVAKAIEESSKAIDSLDENASLDDLVKALNLQIINFATSSNAIPAENKAILDKAVTHLKALPEANLVITGHTDNRGSAEMNQKLSESRAKAVKDYLVSKGVDASKLEAKGVGFEHPVASNATEQGRFKNRRIEFVLIKDGETIIDTDESATKQ